MKPYYEDDFVTLYHGDCREVTAWLDADVLVTDPPYGMTYESNAHRDNRNRKLAAIAHDDSTTVRDEMLVAWGDRPALVFGTWRTPRPVAVRQLVIWDKTHNGPGMGALDLPWGPSHEEVYVMGSGFTGPREGSVLKVAPFNSQSASRPDHPTPKPSALMEALIIKTIGVIADPFAGSGSTLVAAKALVRRAIGVELDERYCEIAAKRLAQDTLFGDVA